MEIISLALITISIGALISNTDTRTEPKTIVFIIAFIFQNLVLSDITHFHWFWNIVVSIIINAFISMPLYLFYASIFGIKTGAELDLRTGLYFKRHLTIIDSLITLILGIILYFL